MIKNFLSALVVGAVALSSTAFAADANPAVNKDSDMIAKCQKTEYKNTKECQDFMQQQGKPADKETTDAVKN